MKTVKKKKRWSGRVLNSVFLGESPYSTHHASEPLGLQRGKIASLHIASTLLSINDVIISLYIRHHVVKQELKTMLSSYFYDVTLRVKQL